MTVCPASSISDIQKPRRLRLGDSVALIAPGSPPDTHEIVPRVIEYLSSLGYQVTVGTHARERLGFLAGTDAQRLSDINEAISSETVQAIFCIRGGYGSGRILRGIDFAGLRKRPKIFVGSSDLCTILNGLIVHAGLTCFHGPTMQSLLDNNVPDFTRNSWKHQIAGDPEALGSISRECATDRCQIETLHSGRTTGRLLGGNLAVLLSVLGTPFFPSLDDSIVFLEDIGETPFRIDRNLTHLLNVGALDRVRGFALGTFERCAYRPEDAAQKQSLRDVVVDRLAPLGKPIVLGLPFGHTSYNATLPVGAVATLDADSGDLSIEELGVS